MRTKCALFLGLFTALACSPALAQPGGKKKAARSDPPVAVAAEDPQRFPLETQRLPFIARIDSVENAGAVEISPSPAMPQLPLETVSPITEGFYLGIVQEALGPKLVGARLIRVQVTEVQENNVLKLQIARLAAEAVKPGELLVLFRPAGITTARMKKLPDLALLEEGPPPGVKGEKKDQSDQARLAQSFNNLKQIGLAMHNFHEAHGHLPPAVIVGPDNKPWHSWRVLILPFLDAADLYNQYKFDEPWDGPGNKKLLDKMPAVFSDPIHGPNKEFYTHYAAVTGDSMSFTAEGADFDGAAVGPAIGGGRGFRQFTDGLSNTLLVGPVGPDRKIPWMKPDDIRVDDKFADLGKKGSFAAPYKMEEGNAAPFLRGDGSVTAIFDRVDKSTFRALLTIDGGEPIGAYPSLNPPPMQGGLAPVIYIFVEGKKTLARLVMEQMMPPHMPQIGPGDPPFNGGDTVDEPDDPFGVLNKGRAQPRPGAVPEPLPRPAPAVKKMQKR